MTSQAYICNTSPLSKTLHKATQGGIRLSFGSTNSPESPLENKTPCSSGHCNAYGLGILGYFLKDLVHKYAPCEKAHTTTVPWSFQETST